MVAVTEKVYQILLDESLSTKQHICMKHPRVIAKAAFRFAIVFLLIFGLSRLVTDDRIILEGYYAGTSEDLNGKKVYVILDRKPTPVGMWQSDPVDVWKQAASGAQAVNYWCRFDSPPSPDFLVYGRPVRVRGVLSSNESRTLNRCQFIK